MRQPLEKQEVGFTQVKNDILNDNKISLRAKGLFAYLYSKPNDWDFSGIRIQNDSKDGKKSTYSAIKELETAGYLKRHKENSGKVSYYIYWDSKKPVPPKGKQPKRVIAEKGNISNKDNITNKENTCDLKKSVAMNSLSDKEPMSSEQFKQWCYKSNQRHIRIIGDYALVKNPNYTNLAQWKIFLKRNLRPAKDLSPFTGDQIEAAYKKMKASNGSNWLKKYTLETIIKYLEEI